MKEIGPLFLAGLVMVLLGAVTVLVFSPQAAKPARPAVTVETVETVETVTVETVKEATVNAPVTVESHKLRDFILQIASIATVVICWGAYGPVLHKGQAAMQHSRLRPLLCVGLAYFAIAVIVPTLLLLGLPEASQYNFRGSSWSLAAGAAGAIGALGIIMAFNFGGKPVFVMPLVFGGAPVVNTLFTTISGGLWAEVSAFFLAGLILVIAGAAIVLVFAPKSPPPVKVEATAVT
jgi:gas vesicle protein